jgi:hypothetical protein
MPELFVMCPECGLRGKLTYSKQEFGDAGGRCKQLVKPAKCSNLGEPLISARRVLDLLEWQARRAQVSVGDDHDAPQRTSD